jgi:hypothetical protein
MVGGKGEGRRLNRYGLTSTIRKVSTAVFELGAGILTVVQPPLKETSLRLKLEEHQPFSKRTDILNR